jgi:hypothetical protein
MLVGRMGAVAEPLGVVVDVPVDVGVGVGDVVDITVVDRVMIGCDEEVIVVVIIWVVEDDICVIVEIMVTTTVRMPAS